jgi:ribonucleoside-diphosphate reductase alpha chain
VSDDAEDLLGSDDAPASPETNDDAGAASTPQSVALSAPQAIVARRRMSDVRPAKTRAFTLRQVSLGGKVEKIKLYFTVGFFEDGGIGEIFIKADKQGAALSGTLDAVGIFASMLLQYGAPLAEVIGKIRGMNFAPYGLTGAQDIPTCSSPLDLLARWLQTFQETP